MSCTNCMSFMQYSYCFINDESELSLTNHNASRGASYYGNITSTKVTTTSSWLNGVAAVDPDDIKDRRRREKMTMVAIFS